MPYLELHFFIAESRVELAETLYRTEDGEAYQTIRGKTAGAFDGAGSFQWTSAVKALAMLALRSVIAGHSSDIPRHISGRKGSPAASLDYALAKRPAWLLDMFGVTAVGRLGARRILLTTNTNCKRPGPVVISINQKVLPKTNIGIFLDGAPVTSASVLLQLLRDIEAGLVQKLEET